MLLQAKVEQQGKQIRVVLAKVWHTIQLNWFY